MNTSYRVHDANVAQNSDGGFDLNLSITLLKTDAPVVTFEAETELHNFIPSIKLSAPLDQPDPIGRLNAQIQLFIGNMENNEPLGTKPATQQPTEFR